MIMLLTMICAAMVLTAFAGPAYADQHGKTVFLTIASFNGNLGGLTGADEKCQAEADGPASIVPSGTYLAWLGQMTAPDQSCINTEKTLTNTAPSTDDPNQLFGQARLD